MKEDFLCRNGTRFTLWIILDFDFLSENGRRRMRCGSLNGRPVTPRDKRPILLVLLCYLSSMHLNSVRAFSVSVDKVSAKVGGENFIKTLMTAEMEPIENTPGIRVMRNLPYLSTGLREHGGKIDAGTAVFETGTYHMVIRSCMEPFWNSCIALVDGKPRHRLGVIGTPGIGKTMATPLLIRMLLERNQTVLYHIRAHMGQGLVYEFKPCTASHVSGSDRSEVETCVYSEDEMDCIPSLFQRSSYYIVDPNGVRGSCDHSRGVCKSIIVVPFDDVYWGCARVFKSAPDSGLFKLFPLWERDELLAANQFMPIKFSEQEICDRFRQVGGIPSHVFSTPDMYETYVKLQNEAVCDLTPREANKIVEEGVRFGFCSSPYLPSSILVGYKNMYPDFFAHETFGSCISPAVRELILIQHAQTLWYGLRRSETNFIPFTRRLIEIGFNFQFRLLHLLGKGKRCYGELRHLKFGGCKMTRLVDCAVDAALHQEKEILYYASERTYELVDFMYQDSSGHCHAFHATIATPEFFNVDGIKKLEEVVGGAQNLSFYLIITMDLYGGLNFTPCNNPESEGPSCRIFRLVAPDTEDGL